MGDRMDEMKGNIKQGVGKMTGDRKMEAEGRGETDIARGKRQIKGAGEEVKGRIEEGIGRISGDDESRARGTMDRAKGNVDKTP